MKLPFNRFNKNDIAFPNVLNWKLNSLVDAFNNGTYESITWEELYNLCEGDALIPGMTYCLTDYQCTVENDSNAQAINEGLFDILIVADDESTLNENVRFIHHSGDTYFSGCNLGAWEGKYCIYNDTTRFAWADETNGKGVIYWLRDEWGNECPYDFKNIQFKRIAISNIEATGITSYMLSELQSLYVYGNNGNICYGQVDQSGFYTPSNTHYYKGFKYTFDDSIESWYYTFTWIDETGVVQDASIVGQQLRNDEGQCSGVFNNEIQPVSQYIFYSESPNEFGYSLNNIVFVSSYSYDGGLFYGCYGNKFGVNCYNNTFGNECLSNTFGSSCFDNTFGNYCYYNTFGNDCYNNTFGNGCDSNTFGNGCGNNTFGNYCCGNAFGTECYYNTFGSSCDSNTFGNGCYRNILVNYCNYNTFGSSCFDNTFGNYCYYNTFGNGCDNNIIEDDFFYFNTFENGVSYCCISGHTTSISNGLKNIKFLSGDYQSFNIDELPIGINNSCVCGINSNSELVLANPVDYLIYGVNTNN